MEEIAPEAVYLPGNNVVETHSGLTIWTTAVFIVGEIAGSGVLALPKAVDDSGWIGIILIILCCFLSAYTGSILGKSWIILQERFPDECGGHVPDPYPLIGEKAFGKFGRYLVSFSINFTLFGVSTVFLLLASENVQALIDDLHKDVSFCYWLMILAAILTPVVWLGTPKDFWPIAVGATIATSIACIILTINVGIDSKTSDPVEHSPQEFMTFFTAFGTIVFAFGGHPAFPTFQADMRRTKDFKWAVLLGYIIVLIMYLPVSMATYFVYGKKVKANILDTVSNGPMAIIVQIMITMHLLFGFVIVINPFCQELEKWLKVPKHFTWKRCITRTLMVALVLFVAESIPHFGAILSLVGGSTTTLLAYVCPSLFYLKLCSMKADEQPLAALNTKVTKIIVPFWEKVLNIEIMFVGIVAGIASTVSAITAMASPGSFTVPCYVNIKEAT